MLTVVPLRVGLGVGLQLLLLVLVGGDMHMLLMVGEKLSVPVGLVSMNV
jgi:hypothetical protein